MAFLPIPTRIKNETREKLRRKKKRTGPTITNPKSPEVKYRRQLSQLTRLLKESVNTDLVPILKQLESEYIADSYARTLEEVFNNLRRSFSGIETQAKIVASDFVDNTNIVNRERFYRAMDNALGIKLENLIQNEGLEDILVATTRSNVGLIRSIPEEYFKQIETIVFDGVTRGNAATSMIKQIQKIGKNTTQRARLIARDQTSKLNSALSQQRQQNLGVEEYVWRTAGDDRVRETHRAHNGKIFRWDDPPPDTGHPGQDIQCRCVAQPVINNIT